MSAKVTAGVCLALTLFLFNRVSAQETAYEWGTVNIGGGGFVSGIIADPNEQNLFYVRTDVGGAYRWDQSSKRWVSMMDWVDVTERGLLGVEAIAVDPQSGGTVYMMCGTSYWNYGRSAFLRSSDRGKSWEVIYTWDEEGEKGSPVTNINVHGNGMGRGNGEALAVDPNDSDIMFYGSKNKGLFKSSDNGSNWTHVDAFTAAAGADTTWNGSGFSFVQYEPGNSAVIYAGFLRENDNVFRSGDGGETWVAISVPEELTTTAGGSRIRLMPQRAVITNDGSALIATFADGAGPHTMAWDEGWGMIHDGFGRGAVFKYDVESTSWSDISPEDYIDGGETGASDYDNVNVADETYEYLAPYGGIAINPDDPLEMVVTTEGYQAAQYWYSQEDGEWKDQWGTNIFHTTDGGETWIPSFQYYWMEGGVSPTVQQMDENGIGWMYNSSIHWSGSVVMDPFNPQSVWVTSGNGVFRTEDIREYTHTPASCDWCEDEVEQRQVWQVVSHGIEEVVPEEVISIPDGPLVSIIADYDGFRHDDISRYPSNRHMTNVNGSFINLGSTRALAYAPEAGILVKVADTRSANPTGYSDVAISPLQFSADSGMSWTVETYPNVGEEYKKGACVAISTDGTVTLWTPGVKVVDGNDVSGAYPVQRFSGSSWSEVSGIDGAYVVGDPMDADVFYAYQKSEGVMYKSIDKGVTFGEVATVGASSFRKIRAAPNRTGDIWVPLTEGGLSRSTDGGETFTAVQGVSYCEAVGFGKAAAGQSYPAVYIFGTVGDETGVFQSIDEGASWVRINDDEHEYGGLANGEFVVGDMNTFGVVYMSTAGRGIACRKPTSPTALFRPESGSGKNNVVRSAVHYRGGKLNLSAIKGDKLSVRLYDLRGRLLFSQNYTKSTSVAVESMVKARGSFILTVRDATGVLFRDRVKYIR